MIGDQNSSDWDLVCVEGGDCADVSDCDVPLTVTNISNSSVNQSQSFITHAE